MPQSRAELEAEKAAIEKRRSDRAKLIAKERVSDDEDYFRLMEIRTTLDPSERVLLCIILNNVSIHRERCAICKGAFHSDIGPALSKWGTAHKLVCDDCGEIHSPELMIALKAYRDLPFDPHGFGRIFIGAPPDETGD
jgi:hypothetical protein